MRTESEVDEFSRGAKYSIIHKCKKCGGTDPDCRCARRHKRMVSAYEACVPRDFWNTKAKDVTHNVEVFKGVVVKYTSKLGRALKHGYGLVFLGDNGVGKTYFMSYILMKAIRAGRTAYYTTMPQLDYNIKRGFKDVAIERRLEWLMSSDFLVIDELGKEQHKREQNSFMDVQVERILKQRCDDSMPVLLATNMDYEALLQAYGPTVGSIISGKFQPAMMKPGDYRSGMAKKMTKDMGY